MIRQPFILTLGVCLVSNLAHANLIQNGSFEDSAFNPNAFSLNLNVPGWGAIPAGFNGNAGPIWPLAADGIQFADIGNAVGPVMSQSFSVGTAGTYVLQWSENTGYYGNLSPGTSPYLVTVTGSAGIIFSQTYDAYNFGVWEVPVQPVALGAGVYTLSFAPQGVYGGYDTLIDAVSVSTPDETDTAAALGGSLLALGFASRWLRR